MMSFLTKTTTIYHRTLSALQHITRRCSTANLNKYSAQLTQKKERGGAQAMLYSLGLTTEDLAKPQIAVGSMWYTGNPCNSKLNVISDKISEGLRKDNLLPMQFNTIGVSDAMSMGSQGMRYSLPSRDLIADSIETIVQAQHYDGVVCIPGCDKNMPGSLMAISRLNRPSMIVYGGSMKPVYYKGMKLDIKSSFESYGEYASGKISEAEFQEIVKHCCDRGCGSCSGLYTANTMSLCLETLGMTLPNSSSNSPGTPEKEAECHQIPKVVKNLLEKDIKPSDILTRKSFLNAIAMVFASGGSTNGVIHLLACAKTAGVELSVQDFEDLNHIPVLLNMKPHGDNVMYDLSTIGGTSKFIKYLIKEGVLDGSCLTITGKSLWENVQSYEDLDFEKQNIVLPLSQPFKDEAHINIMKGNMAPVGCLSKIYKTDDVYRGKAVVYDTEDDMVASLARGEITKESFVIVRYQGESIGCPEMLTPTSSLTGYFGKDSPPLATDGRYSGASHGVLVAHLPDAYKKDSLTRIIKNGDVIEINAAKKEINLLVDEKEIQRRLNEMPVKELNVTGVLKKFSKLCGNFENGYLCE